MKYKNMTLTELESIGLSDPEGVGRELLQRLTSDRLYAAVKDDVEAAVLEHTCNSDTVEELLEEQEELDTELDKLKDDVNAAHDYIRTALEFITDIADSPDFDLRIELKATTEQWLSSVVNDENLGDWRWQR